MSNKGKTKKHVNGEWVECKYEDLKKGDVFRIYKNNAHPCRNKYGGVAFLAMKNPVTTTYTPEERIRNGNNITSICSVDVWRKDEHGMVFK